MAFLTPAQIDAAEDVLRAWVVDLEEIERIIGKSLSSLGPDSDDPVAVTFRGMLPLVQGLRRTLGEHLKEFQLLASMAQARETPMADMGAIVGRLVSIADEAAEARRQFGRIAAMWGYEPPAVECP